MKKLSLYSGLMACVSLVVSMAYSNAHAQEAKVIKVKGQQAIVQFPQGSKPVVGQTLDLGTPEMKSSPGKSGPGSREQLIGAAAELSSSTNSATDKSTTYFAVTGRYGWNLIDYEYGPLASLAYTSTSGASTTALAAGGFFDYNLVPHTAGAEYVYGVGAEAYIGQISPSSGTSSTLMGVFAGGFLKWFPFKNSVAVRGDAGLDYDRTSTSSTSTNVTGLLIKGGLSVYF